MMIVSAGDTFGENCLQYERKKINRATKRNSREKTFELLFFCHSCRCVVCILVCYFVKKLVSFFYFKQVEHLRKWK